MLAIALVALTLQAQITERDVPLIMTTIAEHIAFEDATVSAAAPSQRPRIVLNAVRGATAFREVVPSMAQRLPDAPYFAHAENRATTCVELDRSTCPMRTNEILMEIKGVAPGKEITPAAKPDEYMVTVQLTWTQGGNVQQADKSYGVIKTDGVWQLESDIEWSCICVTS